MPDLPVASQEIEAKFLNINKTDLINKLDSLGATRQFEILYRRQVFDYPDRRLDKDHSWVRLRDEGHQITLTYKHRLGVTDSQKGHNDQGMEEIEVVVSDFAATAQILLKTGLVVKSYAENMRTRYLLNDVEVDIDEWPLLPAYMEIEASDWDKIDSTAELLGYDPEHKVICSTNQIYARAGITFNDYQYITFDKQTKF